MNYSTTQSEALAQQARSFDGMKEQDCPSLGHLIGEVLYRSPTVRLSCHGKDFFLQAANGFVLSHEQSAVDCWVQAHQDFTPCLVLD